MRVLAHGIDIVELSEFERLLQEPTANMANRCFTQYELDKAGEGHRRTERLAARFAAKEAVLKALGTAQALQPAKEDLLPLYRKTPIGIEDEGRLCRLEF